jgi:hypothetical protein
MSFAREDLRRAQIAYDAAVRRWYAARDAGGLVQEDDEHERAAGVRWRAVDAIGRTALGAFQLAKANLDAAASRLQREAGDESCPECDRVPRPFPGSTPDLRLVEIEQDRRLPPERDEVNP